MKYSKKKEEFLNAPVTNNIDWAAQQIISQFSYPQLLSLQLCIGKLDKALYKSWAKEMTFQEIIDAINKVTELLKNNK